jgi:hypothetical protein
MAKRTNQALAISSKSINRRQSGQRPASGKAIDPAGIDHPRTPIRAIQHLAPGSQLAISNIGDDIQADLGKISCPIRRGEQRAFGPFRQGHPSLIIRAIKDGSPDRSLASIDIEITPIAGIGGGQIIDGRQEEIIDGRQDEIWEWDGSQIWRIGISCEDEQAKPIAR